jgi:Zn-dependent protease with chaperone function
MKVSPSVSTLFIADPFRSLAGRKIQFSRLFATHPPIPDRVERLSEMASGIR